MLFSTPIPNDTRFFEALVLAVDAIRGVCKIQTSFGQSMESVPWASDVYNVPSFGDKVLVSTVLGYPIILGLLSKVGAPESISPDINSTDQIDTGNYSPLSRSLVNDPLKPADLVSGDKVVSNEMGGLFGLLKGGTFVARASKLAQILLSKYDDLVRIIGRNYELFTDACTDVIVSVRGRIYRFKGYADTLANARGDIYKYKEYYGDTVLAGSLGTNYYGLTPSTFAAQPAANNIIRKYLVANTSNQILYLQDLYHNDGRYFTQVLNSAGTSYTYTDQTNATFDIKTDNGTTFTRIQTSPTQVTVTFSGSNVCTVILNTTNIELFFDGSNNNKVIIDNGKVQMDFNGTNKATVDSTQVELSYSGGTHFVRANSTGVQLG